MAEIPVILKLDAAERRVAIRQELARLIEQSPAEYEKSEHYRAQSEEWQAGFRAGIEAWRSVLVAAIEGGE